MTTHPDIAKRAYELWEHAGRPAGKDVEYWLQAESEVSQQQRPARSPKAAAQPLLKPSKSRRLVA